jgi:two-component system response regulator RegA
MVHDLSGGGVDMVDRSGPEAGAPSGTPLGISDPGQKILIVEDDAPLRNALVRAFEREQFEVRAADTVKRACEIAYGFAPEFAVLDLSLQDGYGMELVAHLREARPGVRIVVITGYDSIASSVVAVKTGVVDYLAKPVRTEQVIAAIMGLGGEAPAPADRPMSADRVRWEHIQRVLEQCDRNVSETARRLNMHRRTLQRILQKRAPRR